MSGETDEDGKFTVEMVPPGEGYTVVVGFAQGHRTWMSTGDEKAIRRGVAAGTQGVAFVLAKASPQESPFGPMIAPRPPGVPGGRVPGVGPAAGPGAGGGGVAPPPAMDR